MSMNFYLGAKVNEFRKKFKEIKAFIRPVLEDSSSNAETFRWIVNSFLKYVKEEKRKGIKVIK